MARSCSPKERVGRNFAMDGPATIPLGTHEFPEMGEESRIRRSLSQTG